MTDAFYTKRGGDIIKTAQDFYAADDKAAFISIAIAEYKASAEFKHMLEAEAYFHGDNTAIANRPKWKMTKSGKEITFSQNIAISNFFFRFTVQLNQFLLANGVQLDDGIKEKLGFGFDNSFEEAGEMALINSVSYLFFDLDHVEKFEAAGDKGGKGFLMLFDERTSEPTVGIRFWQIDDMRPMYVELFEISGITEFDTSDNNQLKMTQPKRSYKRKTTNYPGGILPAEVKEAGDYGVLPIVPFYANRHHRSEFTKPIKTKIDMYDKIFSDFGDNLERTNDILWVISNFGGTTDEIKEMIAEINELGATYSQSDGSGNSSIMPHTIEVPYAARQIALKILEDSLYADYMAMNFSEISGGSLTNVAIDTAKFNLNTKCNRFEYQAFQAVRKLLQIAGVETENIKFRRQAVSNQTENINNVLAIYDRQLIDKQTALEKLDNIDIDEVKTILERLKEEEAAALSDMSAERELARLREENERLTQEGEETVNSQ